MLCDFWHPEPRASSKTGRSRSAQAEPNLTALCLVPNLKNNACLSRTRDALSSAKVAYTTRELGAVDTHESGVWCCDCNLRQLYSSKTTLCQRPDAHLTSSDRSASMTTHSPVFLQGILVYHPVFHDDPEVVIRVGHDRDVLKRVAIDK